MPLLKFLINRRDHPEVSPEPSAPACRPLEAVAVATLEWGYNRQALPGLLLGEFQQSERACGWEGHSQGSHPQYEQGCPSTHREGKDSEAIQSVCVCVCVCVCICK